MASPDGSNSLQIRCKVSASQQEKGEMLTLLVLGPLFVYTVVASAVWARIRPVHLTAERLHAEICGQQYRSIEHCHKHSSGQTDCEDCNRVSFQKCIYKKCFYAASKRETGPVLASIIWPLLIPVVIGVMIGRKEVGGTRVRKAERVAKRIAALESDIFGEKTA